MDRSEHAQVSETSLDSAAQELTHVGRGIEQLDSRNGRGRRRAERYGGRALVSKVEEVSSSIEQMVRSVKEVSVAQTEHALRCSD